MKTILLVDDEAIFAEAEAKALARFGYEVRTADSGEEAVSLACGGDAKIDLVLMDVDLGDEIDGTEAAHRILSRRNLPIVFLSSHAERDQVEKVRGIARYGYVVKNSGDFVLQSSIEMAFELFDAHEELRSTGARLHTLLKTIPDIVWLKDSRGAYLSCNSTLERLYGAPESEIVGRTDYDFASKEDADVYQANDRRVMASGETRVVEEWTTFPGDGRRRLLETVKTPMIDGSGRLIGVLGIGRDITERKRIEEELKESERNVKNKLYAITEPEGDLGTLDLSEIVDVPTLRSLMEDFSALTGMVVALLDRKGTVLIATGWQDICTRFHRTNPGAAAACTESDLFLAERTKPGEYAQYKCKNGLWDIVTPLYVESRHLGNIYSGQFFYDEDDVDEAFFVEQARKRGFVEEEYLAALRKVPRFSRERITRLMDYLVGLTKFLSRLSLGNLRLARAMAERQRAEELLSKSLEEKETLLKELQHRVKNSLGLVASLLSLNMADLRDDDSRRLFQEAVDRINSISMIYEELSGSSRIDQVDLGAYIRKLVALLSETYAAGSRRVRVISESDAIPCSLKRAVSLGLILNELLTNALKYAYSPEDAGEIRIGLGRVDRSLELRVSDDGTGLPEGFDPKNPTGLGLRIAVLLAEEIGGSLRFETAGHGTTVILNFAEF